MKGFKELLRWIHSLLGWLLGAFWNNPPHTRNTRLQVSLSLPFNLIIYIQSLLSFRSLQNRNKPTHDPASKYLGLNIFRAQDRSYCSSQSHIDNWIWVDHNIHSINPLKLINDLIVRPILGDQLLNEFALLLSYFSFSFGQRGNEISGLRISTIWEKRKSTFGDFDESVGPIDITEESGDVEMLDASMRVDVLELAICVVLHN